VKNRTAWANAAVVMTLVVALVVFVWVRATRPSVENDGGAQPASTNLPTATASASPHSSNTTSNSRPSASSSKETVADEQTLRSVSLIEQYYQLEPSDTPEVRRGRLTALSVPDSSLDVLDFTTGSMSCSDQARLKADDPLIQRASVSAGDAQRTEYTDEEGRKVLYLMFPVILGQYHVSDGTAYLSPSSCHALELRTAGVTWVETAPHTWELTSFSVSEGGGSL